MTSKISEKAWAKTGSTRPKEWANVDSSDLGVPLPDLEMNLPVLPVGWRILVRPVEAVKTTEGGIALAPETVMAQEYLRNHGTVLAIGPLAYADEKKFGNRPWCKVGDIVYHGRGAGVEVFLKDGMSLRLMNDDEIIGVVNDESQLRRKM